MLIRKKPVSLADYDATALIGLRVRVHDAAIEQTDADGDVTIELPQLPADGGGCCGPLPVRTVRWRTVANTLSIGLDVCRWSQCSAGKSKKASGVSRFFVKQTTALSYLAPYLSANTSIAISAAARVGAP